MYFSKTDENNPVRPPHPLLFIEKAKKRKGKKTISMGDIEWETLEKAWAAEFQPVPRKTPLPALIAEADRAVAAAVKSLTKEYESVIGSNASPPPLSAPLSSSPLPSGTGASLGYGSENTSAVSNVDRDGATEGLVDWPTLYQSLCLIQAPMVRCSRPAFRQVCRLWGTKVSYTHMIIADSFVKSPHARHAEFALYAGEDRLVVQLAAKSGPAAAQAAALVHPYCDAVDLNCGCPQRWAMKEGIGAALLEKPELVADMVRSIRNATPEGNGDTPPLPCVVKMRVKDDLRHSVDFARQCEAAGAAWVTVHGRTPHCHPSAAVQFEAVRHVREALAIPVVLNGGVTNVSGAMAAALRTGCGGLMAANGLLDNPAMFYCNASAAMAEAETTFGVPTLRWARSTETREAASCDVSISSSSSSSFAPLRPVSFEWAPNRAANAINSGVAFPPASSVVFRYTVPTMWEAVVTPREAISDFVRCAIRTDLAVPTTVQQVLRMARMYVSPAERNHLALLRSNLSLLNCLQVHIRTHFAPF